MQATHRLDFNYQNLVNDPAGLWNVKPRHGEQNVLVILMDPHRPNTPAPSRELMTEVLQSERESVRHYFNVDSHENLRINIVDILGWYDADQPWTAYWRENAQEIKDAGCAPGSVGQQTGWLGGHSMKWAETVSKADPHFDFSQYDFNGDGTIQPRELAVLLVYPRKNRESGYVRRLSGIQCPSREPFIADNVIIPTIAEWYFGGERLYYSTGMHELSHLFLKTRDMYNMPYCGGARSFSLMAHNQGRTPHHDAFNKLLLGWVQPRFYRGDGNYSLYSASEDPQVLILPKEDDPSEYFLIEYRRKTTGDDIQGLRGIHYDANIQDSGLAIWHIIEDNERNRVPPENNQIEDWAQKKSFRRGVRLVSTQCDDLAWEPGSLWTGNGFQFEGPILKWSDGTRSRYGIQDIRTLESPRWIGPCQANENAACFVLNINAASSRNPELSFIPILDRRRRIDRRAEDPLKARKYYELQIGLRLNPIFNHELFDSGDGRGFIYLGLPIAYERAGNYLARLNIWGDDTERVINKSYLIEVLEAEERWPYIQPNDLQIRFEDREGNPVDPEQLDASQIPAMYYMLFRPRENQGHIDINRLIYNQYPGFDGRPFYHDRLLACPEQGRDCWVMTPLYVEQAGERDLVIELQYLYTEEDENGNADPSNRTAILLFRKSIRINTADQRAE